MGAKKFLLIFTRFFIGGRHEATPFPERCAGKVEAFGRCVRGELFKMRFAPGRLYQHRTKVLRWRHDDLYRRAAAKSQRGTTFVLTGHLGQVMQESARAAMRAALPKRARNGS